MPYFQNKSFSCYVGLSLKNIYFGDTKKVVVNHDLLEIGKITPRSLKARDCSLKKINKPLAKLTKKRKYRNNKLK